MIDQYNEVKECDYKDEHYSVRDNGAVMRHLRQGKRPRKDDGVWTFGIKNSQNGYMMLGQHRVHIIVATAFLGAQDSKVYVVDHIDTNRCNNRVENLRWFTRLENALNNEITRNKIIYICGSIEAFIENPSILRERLVGEPSLEWMRTVTKEEATLAYTNLKRYWEEQAKNPKPLAGGKMNDSVYHKQYIVNHDTPKLSNKKSDFVVSNDEWEQMMKSFRIPYSKVEEKIDVDEEQLVQAKSPDNALQKYWITPVNFECCPTEIGDNPLQDYFDRLELGSVYNSVQFNNEPSIHKVLDKSLIDNGNAIVVMSCNEKGPKPFGLSKITFSNGYFVHENMRTYFKEDGARKYFVIEQGLEWTGGEVFDDLC